MEKEPVDPSTGIPPNYGTDSTAAAPPSYDEATGPPPSYTSIFGEIKDARQGSSSVPEFLKKLVLILVGTIGCTIAIGLFMAIPIAMIVIGAKYKNDCPLEDKIPIYLIVAGSVGVFRNLISLGQRSRSSNNDDDSDKRRNPCSSVLDTFLFIWFICGNVWIYRNYEPDNYTDPDAAGYCNKTLYLFAFWVTTATYIMMGVLCCCICCAAMCAAMFSD
ncbi:transmembrane protein 272-like isoform X1 [Montipora foliosa]|uniref:transmembrane protein 272-like isoform X1 n=1 Tax=Montipora foliosa TaxID=591990 RepID=UPI0035F10105